MNVIKRPSLQRFWERRGHAAAKEPMTEWYKLSRRARWRTFQDVRATFGHTDVAKFDNGKTATIFDIGGNKYRIITMIDYKRQVVLITHVLTHKEYDSGAWKRQGKSRADAGRSERWTDAKRTGRRRPRQ